MGATNRTPVRLTLGLVAAATLLLGACSSSSDDSGTPTTTAASSGSGGSTPGTSASGSSGSGSTGTSAPSGTEAPEEIGNDDIRTALEADEPELWALVDYDVMSWNAFGGFIIPVPEGTEVATAVELCEAVSEVVYEGPDEMITIATGVSIDDLQGTAIVVRESESGTCAAV
jgi:hypothetical protein